MQYFAFISKHNSILPVCCKASDSNQAYDVFSAIGIILTGCYRTQEEAIWSLDSAIPLPHLNWQYGH